MRSSLSNNLNLKANEQIALAGVFRILEGKVRSHVQPDYKDIKHEYYDPKQMKCVKDFLQFYEPVGPKLQCYEGYFNTAIEVHRVNNIYKELLSKNSIE